MSTASQKLLSLQGEVVICCKEDQNMSAVYHVELMMGSPLVPVHLADCHPAHSWHCQKCIGTLAHNPEMRINSTGISLSQVGRSSLSMQHIFTHRAHSNEVQALRAWGIVAHPHTQQAEARRHA